MFYSVLINNYFIRKEEIKFITLCRVTYSIINVFLKTLTYLRCYVGCLTSQTLSVDSNFSITYKFQVAMIECLLSAIDLLATAIFSYNSQRCRGGLNLMIEDIFSTIEHEEFVKLINFLEHENFRVYRLLRYSFVNVRIFFFWDLVVDTFRLLWKQIPYNFVHNCYFRVSFIMECKISIFDTFYLLLFSWRQESGRSSQRDMWSL